MRQTGKEAHKEGARGIVFSLNNLDHVTNKPLLWLVLAVETCTTADTRP